MCPTDTVSYYCIGHCFTIHKSLALSLANTGIYCRVPARWGLQQTTLGSRLRQDTGQYIWPVFTKTVWALHVTIWFATFKYHSVTIGAIFRFFWTPFSEFEWYVPSLFVVISASRDPKEIELLEQKLCLHQVRSHLSWWTMFVDYKSYPATQKWHGLSE